MFEQYTYKRCACTVPVVDASGDPVLTAAGKPKIRYLEKDCPQLRRRDHGSWYYSIELPAGPGGERTRPKKGGFKTQKAAADKAKKVWEAAQDGVQVLSQETVAEYLHRWLAARADIKRSTRKGYEYHVDKVFIPALGHLKMRDLRARHIQQMFEKIWEENKERASNQVKAQQALEAERVAYQAWKAAAKPRPRGLRAEWTEAKAALKAARKKPRHITGPGGQKKMLNTLAAALEHAAVRDKLIAENWAKHVVIPKYTRPRPQVWTEERVAAWRRTGVKPGKVMVWTPEQTGTFLDAVSNHRLYPFFHLAVFRGLRRGELCGLPWAETDVDAGTVHISTQLVSAWHDVYEDEPKSEASERTISLDSETTRLLALWQARQKAERTDWEQARAAAPAGKRAPYEETGLVFTWEDGRAYHPDTVTQFFTRRVAALGLPPIRLHDLRHCAATLSLAAGLHMKAIQKLLGHSSYALTADTYTSVLPQFEKAQAEAPLALVPRQSTARALSPVEPDEGTSPAAADINRVPSTSGNAA